MFELKIINYLTYNKEPAISKYFARRVGEVDRTLNAVTKPELFRQAYGRVTNGKNSAGAANFFDNIAALMRRHLFLHRRHHVGRAQVDVVARCRAAGNKIRAHKILRRFAATCLLEQRSARFLEST